jgi:hypothetical protein
MARSIALNGKRRRQMASTTSTLPIAIGVTGHRDVPADAQPRLRACFGDVLARYRKDYPSTPLLVLTGLAAGADTFAAEEAIARNVPVMACLPMEASDYEADFTPEQRERFRRVLAQCARVVVVGKTRDRVRNYVEVGLFIAYYSHALVAFWDGNEGRGAGGTADVVRMRETGVPSALSAVLQSYLPDVGPVCHIVTPREGQPEPASCYSTIARYPLRERGATIEARDFTAMLRCFDTYNRDIAHQPAAPGNDGITTLLERTDEAANRLQRSSLLVIVALYAMAFVAGSAQLIDNAPGGIVTRFSLLALAFLLFVFARRNNFENRYQDYRAVAEGLRVQRAWHCAGLDGRLVEASYLHMQRGELQWIRLALRTAYLLYIFDQPTPGASPDHPGCASWIDGQRAYYRRAGQREQRWVKVIGIVSNAVFGAGIAAFASGLVLAHFAAPGTTGTEHVAKVLQTTPMAIGALLALLLRFYVQQRGYVENTRRYQHMFLVFDFARTRLAAILNGYEGSPSALLEELGREALVEHANWLILHRERPLTFISS